MYGFYFWQTVCLLRNEHKTLEGVLAKGIMISLIGYLLMGITNDSSVTVAPLSFVILGLGFAINRIIAAQENVKEKGNV